MNIKSKKTEILIPENMDNQTAQQCFLFGLRIFSSIYKGGVVINYALDDKKGISNHEEAGAVIDFINAIHDINSEWKEKKEKLEQIGTEKLKQIKKSNN